MVAREQTNKFYNEAFMKLHIKPQGPYNEMTERYKKRMWKLYLYGCENKLFFSILPSSVAPTIKFNSYYSEIDRKKFYTGIYIYLYKNYENKVKFTLCFHLISSILKCRIPLNHLLLMSLGSFSYLQYVLVQLHSGIPQ